MEETAIDGYDEATKTFYVAKTLSQGEALTVYIPAVARMVSIDVRPDSVVSSYDIYVTNSNYADAEVDADNVTWHPTAHMRQHETLFTTKSACAGAYKVVFTAGSGIVKARAK